MNCVPVGCVAGGEKAVRSLGVDFHSYCWGESWATSGHREDIYHWVCHCITLHWVGSHSALKQPLNSKDLKKKQQQEDSKNITTNGRMYLLCIYCASPNSPWQQPAITDDQCSVNRFNLGSARLACDLGRRQCTRRTSVGLCSCEAQLVGGWWLMQPLLRAGLTSGPDNHLLEVRLTLPSDRSLSWICLPALCTPSVEGALLFLRPFPAFVSFHI